MQLIDSHCHLSNLDFQERISEVIAEANEQQIFYFLQAGYNPDDWEVQQNLCNKYKGILPVFGLHPEWVATCTDSEVETALDKLSRQLKGAFAIGEVGLDLREKYLKSFLLQMDACEKQIELARIAGLPLVFHIVHAHYEFLTFLDHFDLPKNGGFIHSFNGSWETAKSYIDKGLLLSISGSISYEKNKKLREAVKKIPSEFLLIETDCPDQVPAGWGSDLYSPKGIWQVAKVVAELRSESAEQLLIQSSKNLYKLLKIKDRN